MAKCDYFCCRCCDEKVIHDGYGRLRDEVAFRFGMDEDDGWMIDVICFKCSADSHIHIVPPEKQTERRSDDLPPQQPDGEMNYG